MCDDNVNIINQPIIYQMVDAIWDLFRAKLNINPFIHHWNGIDRELWIAIQNANSEMLGEVCRTLPNAQPITFRVALWIDHVIPELIHNEENFYPNNRQCGDYISELRRFFNSLHDTTPPKQRWSCAVQ